MAEFGAKHPCFKRNDAAAGIIIGKLVAANLTVNLATGEMFADDELAEQVSMFASGSLAMQTDDLEDYKNAEIYGCEVQDGLVISRSGDSAPLGCVAYYKSLMRNGVKLYRAYYYDKVRAAIGNDNAQTKGSSITFQPTNTTFTIFAGNDNRWREFKTFDNEAAAIAWCESKTGVAEWHEVKVLTCGAGTGEGVDHEGSIFVADGEDAAIAIEGTVTKLYDNGEDKTSDIAEGVYTITDVAEAHNIAVIF